MTTTLVNPKSVLGDLLAVERAIRKLDAEIEELAKARKELQAARLEQIARRSEILMDAEQGQGDLFSKGGES